MIRRFSSVLAVVVLLLLAAPVLPARGEGAAAGSTPTDLCTHDRTTVEYYFDSPVYRSLDERTHSVSGRATVVTTCAYCGTVLSAVVDENARQVKRHAFVRGRCALCGQEGAPPRETEVLLEKAEEPELPETREEQFSAAFTADDLAGGEELWVLRAGDYAPAVVLQPRRLGAALVPGQVLQAEMNFTNEWTVAISLEIRGEDGETAPADPGLAALRVYGEKEDSVLSFTYQGEEAEKAEERMAFWMDYSGGGYYQLSPFPGNGAYEF